MKIFEDIFAIPVAKNKNENNLDMILVANLVFSASFHWEKIFKIPLETMLFSCEVKMCSECTWEIHKFHKKTPALESFFNPENL